MKSKIKWTDQKRIVWQTVENYTEQILKGETNSFLKCFHKNYLGWNNFHNNTIKKSDIKKELKNLPKFEIISYSVNPGSIQILNDIAIVHYSYSVKYKDSLKQIKTKTSNHTDILLKDNDSWLIIGDHIGSEDNSNKITINNQSKY